MIACTSIGAMHTYPSQQADAATNPASVSCEKYENLASPPATGNAAPSSAYTSASSNVATAAISQLRIAAGPAICATYIAANSHADPITLPVEMNNSPTG